MALNYNETLNKTNFSPENIVFGDIKKFTIPATFQRIPISYRYADGNIQKLSVRIPNSLSWGLQENKNAITQVVESYTFSFVMHDKNGPNPEQAATIQMLDDICSTIKAHLLQDNIKEQLNSWDKTEDVKRMSIMYRKKDKGKVIKDYAPTLYPKLLVARHPADGSTPPISTGFYDIHDTVVNPHSLKDRCEAIGAVVVDNVYIGGGRFSIQLKLNDVIITKQFNQFSRLLSPTTSSSPVVHTLRPNISREELTPDENEQPQQTIVYKRRVV